METRLRTERGQGREEKEEEKCQTAHLKRSLFVEEREKGKRALGRGRSLIGSQTEDRERMLKQRKRRGKMKEGLHAYVL